MHRIQLSTWFRHSILAASIVVGTCCSNYAQSADDQQPPAALPTPVAQSRKTTGLPGVRVFSLVHTYEPNEGGYTWDQGDDSFLDFTLSVMLPVIDPALYPPLARSPANYAKSFRPFKYDPMPTPFFAMTDRAGQYIGTRDSAPVVNKRFNPVFGLRWWAIDGAAATPQTRQGVNQAVLETEDNFVELVYAHESNGQYIASEDRFKAQIDAYMKGNTMPTTDNYYGESWRSARDNISRGWDYVGIQFARDWDVPWSWRPYTVGLHAKFNYYLPWGIFQHGAEDYRLWEAQADGKPRKTVDGLSLRFTAVRRDLRYAALPLIGFLDRNSLIVTTGYDRPLRYTTVQVESDVSIKAWPITFWYRYGYNMDLIDYYHRNHSFGVKLSIWKFQAP